MRRLLSFLSAVFALLFVLNASAEAQTASVRERIWLLNTYPFSDPDPVPRMSRIYPYFRFDGFTDEPVEQTWKVVVLENAWIKVLVAPQIGGKILGAFEKSTGKDFVYFNPVVKFRDIAMRGPWTAGGIELNFGSIGHAPTTSTDVDYSVRTNPDASVSCFVGSMDLSSRTRWQVEIRLPPDKAFFEVVTQWHNPSDFSTSLYHWMNGSARARSDLRFFFPGTAYIGHGGRARSWPLDSSGRDLSLYGNNDFGTYKSYHVLGEYTDWFGGIYEEDKFGFGHWSLYGEKPGKKIWIWGLSREGMIWEKLLTDTVSGGTQYIEIQAGALFNQAGKKSSRTPFKHRFLLPGQTISSRELWFPVTGLPALHHADPHAALYADHNHGRLSFALCPLEPIDDIITVYAEGREVYRKAVRLKPLQTFSDEVETGSRFRIALRKVSFSYTTDGKKLARPLHAPPDFDRDSTYGRYLDGAELARQRSYKDALKCYENALRKNPFFIPALTGAAELYLRKGEYRKALALCTRALSVDAYDPAANYWYGLAQRFLGNTFDAMDGFSIAASSPQFGTAANCALASLAVSDRRFEDALHYAEAAGSYNSRSSEALLYRSLAFRKLGKNRRAETQRARLRAEEPLNHAARFERYFLAPSEAAEKNITTSIRNEFPAQTFLESACWYHRMGLFDEAAAVLKMAPASAMVRYWQSHTAWKAGRKKESSQFLDQAIGEPCRFVFPYRRESIDVLQWALERKPAWKTRYYLALLYWSRGRRQKAKKCFSDCGENPGFAPFYFARARFCAEDDPAASLRDLERGVACDPDAWRGYKELTEACIERSNYRKALMWAEKAAKRFPGRYVLQFNYAQALLYAGKHDACIGVLEKTKILPHEGAEYGRNVWRQACVCAALSQLQADRPAEARTSIARARTWPENLGVGKPYDVDTRIEDFLQGYCFFREGKAERAEALFQKVVDAGERTFAAFDSQTFLSVLAYEYLGKKDKAKALIERWSKKRNDSVARWAHTVFEGGAVDSFVPSGAFLSSEGTPWNPVKRDSSFKLVQEITHVVKEK